jgi:hypothetical protein
MRSAFASIVQARPCPTFGRPVRLRGSPHRLRPGTSPQALRIPPRDGHPALRRFPGAGFRSPLAVSRFPLRARLELSIPLSHFGQRGITPAFGYGTPHPGARGTSTLLISALPGAHYEPIRLPASARRYAPVFPRVLPPTVTMPSDPAGSPGFRCRPFIHDTVLDPGGATPPRITVLHMLPSCTGTHSASAIFGLSGLTCRTLHDSCLRFGRHVTGPPARLGSLLPATALERKDSHLLVNHQLFPAHSRGPLKSDGIQG